MFVIVVHTPTCDATPAHRASLHVFRFKSSALTINTSIFRHHAKPTHVPIIHSAHITPLPTIATTPHVPSSTVLDIYVNLRSQLALTAPPGTQRAVSAAQVIASASTHFYTPLYLHTFLGSVGLLNAGLGGTIQTLPFNTWHMTHDLDGKLTLDWVNLLSLDAEPPSMVSNRKPCLCRC